MGKPRNQATVRSDKGYVMVENLNPEGIFSTDGFEVVVSAISGKQEKFRFMLHDGEIRMFRMVMRGGIGQFELVE